MYSYPVLVLDSPVCTVCRSNRASLLIIPVYRGCAAHCRILHVCASYECRADISESGGLVIDIHSCSFFGRGEGSQQFVETQPRVLKPFTTARSSGEVWGLSSDNVHTRKKVNAVTSMRLFDLHASVSWTDSCTCELVGFHARLPSSKMLARGTSAPAPNDQKPSPTLNPESSRERISTAADCGAHK